LDQSRWGAFNLFLNLLATSAQTGAALGRLLRALFRLLRAFPIKSSFSPLKKGLFSLRSIKPELGRLWLFPPVNSFSRVRLGFGRFDFKRTTIAAWSLPPPSSLSIRSLLRFLPDLDKSNPCASAAPPCFQRIFLLGPPLRGPPPSPCLLLEDVLFSPFSGSHRVHSETFLILQYALDLCLFLLEARRRLPH